MSTKQIVILVVVLVVVVFGTIFGALALLVGVTVPRARDAQNRSRCRNNLRQIGCIVTLQVVDGRLRKLEGPAYILQIAKDVNDEDLEVFVCPGAPGARELGPDFQKAIRTLDPAHAGRFCSYRGPDHAALEAWKKANPGMTAIIACCAQGDDGRHPYHEEGVCVLYETGKVEFIPYSNMTGYAGGPVQVGPDSPDARFRHLVR